MDSINSDIKNDFNKKIYVLQYPLNYDLSISIGSIIKVNNLPEKYFCYKCPTGPGSRGGPIINFNNNKVIGIHRGNISYINKSNKKIGIPIKYIFEEFSEELLKSYKNANSYLDESINYYNCYDDNNNNNNQSLSKIKDSYEKRFDKRISLLDNLENINFTLIPNKKRVSFGSSLGSKNLLDSYKNIPFKNFEDIDKLYDSILGMNTIKII